MAGEPSHPDIQRNVGADSNASASRASSEVARRDVVERMAEQGDLPSIVDLAVRDPQRLREMSGGKNKDQQSDPGDREEGIIAAPVGDPGDQREGDPQDKKEGDPGEKPTGDAGERPQGDPGERPAGDPGDRPEGDPGGRKEGREEEERRKARHLEGVRAYREITADGVEVRGDSNRDDVRNQLREKGHNWGDDKVTDS